MNNFLSNRTWVMGYTLLTIFIDEIDSIAPNREKAHGKVERKIVSQIELLNISRINISNISMLPLE